MVTSPAEPSGILPGDPVLKPIRPDGGAVLSSCSLLHEALPVNSGRRFALFSFLGDEAGAEQKRKLIGAGREGLAMRIP